MTTLLQGTQESIYFSIKGSLTLTLEAFSSQLTLRRKKQCRTKGKDTIITYGRDM